MYIKHDKTKTQALYKLSSSDSTTPHFPKLLRILACRKSERQNMCETRQMLHRITFI